MKGGNILGQGGYGCVLEQSDTQVAKVLQTTPSFEEIGLSQEQFFANQEQIHSFDPEENYFITTRDIFKSRLQDLPEEIASDIVQCQKRQNTRAYRKVGIPVNVTLQLQTRVSEAPPISTWTPEQVQHAWDGLQLLHSHGYVHGDIYIKNMGFRNGMPVQIDLDQAQQAQELSISLRRNGRPFVKTMSSYFQDIQRFDEMLEGRE